NPKYAPQLASTRAGAILVSNDLGGTDARYIRVANPYLAWAAVIERWFAPPAMITGVSPLASIAPSAKLGRNVAVGPFTSIAHGARVGKHCLLVAQVGIAGSTELGDYVVVAGQSGFAGHLRIGDRVQFAAKSAVLDDVPADTKVMGNPAVPFREFARREALI